VSQVEEFMESFMRRWWNILTENLLIFVSTKPDKRSRFYKFLKENANLKEFPVLKESELVHYIKNDLWDKKMSDKVIIKFIQKVGNELYRIRSELDKLKIYCDSQNLNDITTNMVDDIVFWLLETEVSDFLKLIFIDKVWAIDYLQKMQDQWLNWNAFSGLLYWWLKLYIVLYEFAKKGIKDTKTIASQTGINPYRLMQNIKNIDIILKNWIEIQNMYKRLIEIEVDIKNGKKLELSFRLETKKLINSFQI
jgi:DNA polymerase III delta subunit